MIRQIIFVVDQPNWRLTRCPVNRDWNGFWTFGRHYALRIKTFERKHKRKRSDEINPKIFQKNKPAEWNKRAIWAKWFRGAWWTGVICALFVQLLCDTRFSACRLFKLLIARLRLDRDEVHTKILEMTRGLLSTSSIIAPSSLHTHFKLAIVAGHHTIALKYWSIRIENSKLHNMFLMNIQLSCTIKIVVYDLNCHQKLSTVM